MENLINALNELTDVKVVVTSETTSSTFTDVKSARGLVSDFYNTKSYHSKSTVKVMYENCELIPIMEDKNVVAFILPEHYDVTDSEQGESSSLRAKVERLLVYLEVDIESPKSVSGNMEETWQEGYNTAWSDTQKDVVVKLKHVLKE